MFTLEELLKLAQVEHDKVNEKLQKRHEKQEEEVPVDDARKFCLAIGIATGKKKVKCGALYEAYKKWSKEPLPKFVFFKKFSLYFKRKSNGKFRYYKLSKNITTIEDKVNKVIVKNEEKTDQKG